VEERAARYPRSVDVLTIFVVWGLTLIPAGIKAM
jgi:hypothetical protein